MEDKSEFDILISRIINGGNEATKQDLISIECKNWSDNFQCADLKKCLAKVKTNCHFIITNTMQKGDCKINVSGFKGNEEKGFKSLANFLIFKMIRKNDKLELILLPGIIHDKESDKTGVVICIPRAEIYDLRCYAPVAAIVELQTTKVPAVITRNSNTRQTNRKKSGSKTNSRK